MNKNRINNIILPVSGIKTPTQMRTEKCLEEIHAVLQNHDCVIIPRIIITGPQIESQYMIIPKENMRVMPNETQNDNIPDGSA